MEVDVLGTYKVKPLPATLQLFTRTFNPDVFWRQDPGSIYFDDTRKLWYGKVNLWKGIGWSPYPANIIAIVLDEAGKDMVLYADKVQRETGKNVEFARLPSYIEKCDDEIKVNRD